MKQSGLLVLIASLVAGCGTVLRKLGNELGGVT